MDLPSKNILVLDIETQKSFKEVGKAKLEKLRVSVACIYDYQNDHYTAYEEKEVMNLEKRIQEADFVIGFNIRRFDFPVLAPYLFMPIDTLPVLDLLDDIEKVRGHRASLDSIAGPTLKRHKIGTGADALILFKENRMEELKKYCFEDVRITKEIFEYGCKHGKILFTSSWDYKTYEVPVQWKETANSLCQKSTDKITNFPSSLF